MRITVNGFRSLRDFQIELTPGINVLVGPNGSGKTNFLESLSFVYDLIHAGASEAVSNAGGLYRVFSQESLQRSPSSMSITVCDYIDLSQSRITEEQSGYINFRYTVTLVYRRKRSLLYISMEKLELSQVYDQLQSGESYLGAISVSRSRTAAHIPQRIVVGTGLRPASNEKSPLSLRRRGDKSGKQDTVKLIDTIETKGSIFDYAFRVPILRMVERAIFSSRPLSITPHKCKLPDDVSTPPIVNWDGSGLSATINMICAINLDSSLFDEDDYFNLPKDAYQSVMSWTAMIFPELRNIDGRTDLSTGKITAWFEIGAETGSPVRVPIAALSDGTVKWLALVTYLLSNRRSFAIEEPENFLHPQMQVNLIGILREYAEERGPVSVLISSHSETVINLCRPEELIIFSFDEGSTGCRRIKTPQSVRDEINRTGFGLGRYFADNAL